MVGLMAAGAANMLSGTCLLTLFFAAVRITVVSTLGRVRAAIPLSITITLVLPDDQPNPDGVPTIKSVSTADDTSNSVGDLNGKRTGAAETRAASDVLIPVKRGYSPLSNTQSPGAPNSESSITPHICEVSLPTVPSISSLSLIPPTPASRLICLS